MVFPASFTNTYISVRAWERAGVQAGGRADVRKIEFRRGLLSAFTVCEPEGIIFQSVNAERQALSECSAVLRNSHNI